MSIEREDGKVIIVCDTCDASIADEDFEKAWAKAKGAHWRTRKIGTLNPEWVHGCPECGV